VVPWAVSIDGVFLTPLSGTYDFPDAVLLSGFENSTDVGLISGFLKKLAHIQQATESALNAKVTTVVAS
ncbi:hypothetical protein QCD71_25480, partial [Sphingomonas sp. PsM26]|nr:hypothetical protein [Sphingomonas sp. PsM26]